jgi:hypothetical protein
VRQSCVGGFGVVAQRRRGLAGPLEVGGELGSGDRRCRAALSFQGDGDLAMKLGASGGCRALVQTWRKSACRNEYGNSSGLLPPSARGATSHNCPRASSSHVWPTQTASRSSAPEIAWTRNSMPQTAAAESTKRWSLVSFAM